MKSTIDAAGRFVIPREVRRAAGLEPGMVLDVRVDDGAVVIEPAAMPVRMVASGSFVVARPVRPVLVLTEQTVLETRERLSSERGAARGKKKR